MYLYLWYIYWKPWVNTSSSNPTLHFILVFFLSLLITPFSDTEKWGFHYPDVFTYLFKPPIGDQSFNDASIFILTWLIVNPAGNCVWHCLTMPHVFKKIKAISLYILLLLALSIQIATLLEIQGFTSLLIVIVSSGWVVIFILYKKKKRKRKKKLMVYWRHFNWRKYELLRWKPKLKKMSQMTDTATSNHCPQGLQDSVMSKGRVKIKTVQIFRNLYSKILYV